MSYRKGRYAEYRFMDYARRAGAVYVARTAGSHTLFDVIAIFPNGDVWLVQVKRGKGGFRERKGIEELSNKIKGDRIYYVLARYDGRWHLEFVNRKPSFPR